MAQSVKHLTLAQVMISRFVASHPASDSVLTAQSLEPASGSVSHSLSLSLSAPAPLTFCLSPSLSKINVKTNLKKKKITRTHLLAIRDAGEKLPSDVNGPKTERARVVW